MSTDPLSAYRATIERELRAGNATEHTHRPALQRLIESLAPGTTATNEPRRVACGAPDYVVWRQTDHGPLTLGHIEAKIVGASLAEIERSDQLRRYLSALDNLLLTDYLEFRWYVGGQRRLAARLETPGPAARQPCGVGGAEEVRELLGFFLEHRAEPITEPQELAKRLARIAHIIRELIVGAFETRVASANLQALREALAEVLIPDLSVADFADMYAQTLAYGMFAARANHKNNLFSAPP
jgi:hypothetical protein